MEKDDILTKIEVVLPKLQHYAAYKEVTLDATELAIIKEIAPAILPDRGVNFNCSPCAGEFLTILYSYYQRESQ